MTISAFLHHGKLSRGKKTTGSYRSSSSGSLSAKSRGGSTLFKVLRTPWGDDTPVPNKGTKPAKIEDLKDVSTAKYSPKPISQSTTKEEETPINPYGFLKLAELVRTGEDSDVQVFVGEGKRMKEFQLHKTIICHNSGYFRQMLKSGFREANEGKIHLPEHTEEVFEHVSHWLYDGEVVDPGKGQYWHINMWAKIIKEASYFQIPSLKKRALAGFLENMNDESRREEYRAGKKAQYSLVECILTFFEIYDNEKGLVDQAFSALKDAGILKEILEHDCLKSYLVNEAPEVMLKLLEFSTRF